MGPFCVTRSNPTYQLTDPTQPMGQPNPWATLGTPAAATHTRIVVSVAHQRRRPNRLTSVRPSVGRSRNFPVRRRSATVRPSAGRRLYITSPRRRRRRYAASDSKCIWRCRRSPAVLLSYPRLTRLVGMQSAADRFIIHCRQRHARLPCVYNDRTTQRSSCRPTQLRVYCHTSCRVALLRAGLTSMMYWAGGSG